MVSVPLYDTLGPDAVRYISGHAELAAIACSVDLLSVLLPCLSDCPTIQLVVGGADRSGYALWVHHCQDVDMDCWG